MDPEARGERHNDDELASALEEEVARITSAIPIIVQRDGVGRHSAGSAGSAGSGGSAGSAGSTRERVSFDELPERPRQSGPEPTFSPWIATSAVPVQKAEAEAAQPTASDPSPGATPAPQPAAAEDRAGDAVSPPAFRPVNRAEPLGLVPEDLAPRDSQPVPVLAASEPEPTPEPEPEATSYPPAQAATPVTTATADSAPIPSPRIGDTPAAPSGHRPAPGLFVPETADLEPAPLDQRVGRASRMFWLWFAGTSSLISVGVGATLFVLGLSLRQLLVATLVGVALSFLPLGLATLAGKWSGQPTLVVSRATFGMLGNLLPTVIALLVKLFWGAVLLWLAGSAAGSLTTAENWPGSPVGATSAALAVTILIAVAVAYFGYALLARVQLVLTVASAVLIVLMVMATWRHVDMGRALAVPDALWTHVATGAVLVFSYVGLAWAMSSAEVARYQRPRSSGGAAMLWATFGAGVPPFVLVSYGGLLAASHPGLAGELARDPVAGLVRLGLPAWYPVPLLLAVGLSLISALVLTVYSFAFTVDALGVRLGRRRSTLLAGAAIALAGGVLAATVTDLDSVIRGVPTALSVPVAAWVGVFSGEMMLRTRRFHQPSLTTRGGIYPDWRWTNLGLLLAGTAVGLGTVSSPLPWLAWEGYLFRLVGIDPHAGIGASNIGVVIALVIGFFGVLVSAVPAVRDQELAIA